MIRSKSLRMFKKKTPGNRRTIHYKKFPKKSLLKSHPKDKREAFKAMARK